ncbi:MAG TPA: RHS repeat-associated core domain-containing protein, partial [Gemmatimonadales bacterium]|nr:RHS repeat-associated core domain-containing protein [Gemmatimonadales bacterium]
FAAPQVPGVAFFRHRAYDSRTGRWTQEDPLGLAGGLNLYQFNGNNPVTFTDPFGLVADTNVAYNTNGAEIGRWGSDKTNQYFLVKDGQVHNLDYALKAGSSPYEIHDSPGEFDAIATSLAAAAPAYGNRLLIGLHSLPNGTLDFKRSLPDRSLWNAGNGLYVHKDKVGNAAWGNYMARRGYSLATALGGASLQGASVGGEDPLDQRMIRRGYNLPH